MPGLCPTSLRLEPTARYGCQISMGVYGSITRGTVSRALGGSTARVLETVHRPYSSIDWHDHEDLSLDVVVAGSFQEYVDGDVFERGVGSLVIKPSGVAHRDVYGKAGTRTFVVHVSPSSPLLEAFGHLFTRTHHQRATDDRIAIVLAEVLECIADSSMAVDDAVITCLDQLSPPAPPAVAIKTLSAMRARVLDDVVSTSLTSIAEEFGLSPSAFTHAFRARYGCTPSTMRRRYRLDRACQLLRHSAMTISEIAAHAGFADQPHLTRECRRLLGVTPRHYRRMSA